MLLAFSDPYSLILYWIMVKLPHDHIWDFLGLLMETLYKQILTFYCCIMRNMEGKCVKIFCLKHLNV